MVEPMSDSFALPPKPKSKTVIGHPISVTTNFFKFFIETKRVLYIYTVDVSPELPADSAIVYRTLTKNAHTNLMAAFQIYKFIGRNLVSPTKLIDTKIPSKVGDTDYMITLSFVRCLQVDDWYRLKDPREVQLVKGFFNCLIKGYLSELRMVELGRSQKYFDTKSIRQVQGSDIEVWTGYKTCVNIYENNSVYLQIDYASRCLNTTSVLTFLSHLKGTGRSTNDMKEELKDKTVLARYGKNKLYKITDIDFSTNPTTKTFAFREKTVTVEQYMEAAYQVKIKDKNQPLIISEITPRMRRDRKGPPGQKLENERVYLVPELLYMTGITDENKNDHEFMKNLAVYTKLEPQKRTEKYSEILNKFEKLTLDANSPSSLWGVKIDPKPIVFNAIALPPPRLILGKSKEVLMDNRGTFILKEEVFTPLTFKKWVFIHTSRDEENAGEIVETMKKASRAFGISITEPNYIVSGGMRASNFIDAAKQAPGAEIYVFLLPPPAKNEYGKIKAFLFGQGALSQMIISKRQKNLMSVCSKIVLQMNAKLKGVLWKLNMSSIHLAKINMMIGIDMSTDKGKTVIAFTSSYDPAFMSYFSQLKVMEAGQSIANCIKEFMLKALDYFYKATNSKFYPEMVFVYRQGLGETQFDNVRKVEVTGCNDALKDRGLEDKTKLIFTLMNKKVNDRAFTSSGGSDKRGGYSHGGLSNPPCGTLIDSVIVSDKAYEFFIQPQFVNQGTGTPTKFTVLFDNTGLDDREFKLATYYLCYGYQNWMGGIRVPAPTMYAAKLAKLVVKSAKQTMPGGNLPATLHYL